MREWHYKCPKCQKYIPYKWEHVEWDDDCKDENGEYDFECLEAIDLELFNDHLTRLLNGEEVEMPQFDFLVGTKRYNGKKLKL